MMMTSSAGGVHNERMNASSLKRYAWLSIGSALATILLFPLPAVAWNAAGHRLVAGIAWEFLDAQARSEATRLLREHPDHERWLKRAEHGDMDRIVFIEASTWPDEIRQDKRFYSAGIDESRPHLPGFPDMERHRDWHYVNRPINGVSSEYFSPGQIDTQLVALVKTLATKGAPTRERTYALPWLIHLMGDAHQPLHTSVRLDADGRWDKLGNGMSVINPFNPRKNTSTLHTFWDDLPGAPGLRGERLDMAIRALIAAYPRPPHCASSEQWVDESWRIARGNGYPLGQETTPTITEGFFENSREIAKRRVTEAGYRLADLLNQLFNNEDPVISR